jgi:HK97 family phage prohead protease
MNLHFSTPLEFKAPEAGGQFVGYLAVLNSVDLGGDSIQPGSFQKTLAETKARGTPIPLLWSHDPSIVLGRFTELNEDAKGLFARGQLTLGTEAAREKYALLKDRAVTGLSIGYSVPDGGSERRGGTRLLKQIDLHEGSLVAVPMHPDARIAEVKSLLDCTDEREIRNLLRERDCLSRTKATAAADALWRILSGRDEGAERLAARAKSFLQTLKGI